MYIEFNSETIIQHAKIALRLIKYYDVLAQLKVDYFEGRCFCDPSLQNTFNSQAVTADNDSVRFIINHTDKEIEHFISERVGISVEAVEYAIAINNGQRGTRALRLHVSMMYFSGIFGELSDHNLKRLFFNLSLIVIANRVDVFQNHLDEIHFENEILRNKLNSIRAAVVSPMAYSIFKADESIEFITKEQSILNDSFLETSLYLTYIQQESYNSISITPPTLTRNCYSWKHIKLLLQRMDHRFLASSFATRILYELEEYCDSDSSQLGRIERANLIFEIIKRIPEDQIRHYTYTREQSDINWICTNLKTTEAKMFTLDAIVGNFSNYLRISKLCHLMEKDPKAMDYFKPTTPMELMQTGSREVDITLNLGRVGLTIESIVKSYFKDMARKCEDSTFLQQLFDPKHYPNILNYEDMYRESLDRHSNWLERYMEDGDSYPTLSQISLAGIMLDSDYGFAGALDEYRHVGPKMTSNYQVLRRESRSQVLVLLYNWLYKFTGWIESETEYTEDGHFTIVSHHTVLTDYTHFFAHALNTCGSIEKFLLILPENINVHPADFFKDKIAKLGKEQIAILKDPLKLVPFRELPPNISGLPSDKWEHMNCASRLITEGNRMSHCVGGGHFINRGEQGDLFFHYDDGSKYGLTIHLPVQYLDDPDHNGHSDNPFSFFIPREDRSSRTFMFDPCIDGKVERLYVLGQIQGKRNTDPGEEVIDEILTTLKSHCSLHDLYEDRKKKNWYIEGDESYALSA